MKILAIFGASGHGKVVADLAECLGYNVVFFDDAYPERKNIEHWSVIGSFDDLLRSQKKYINTVVAIGNNEIRFQFYNQLEQAGFILPFLIHPTAVVSKYAIISSGTVVFANTVINAFAQIGGNCIINTGAIVEHDCMVGNTVHLSPNVSLAGGTIVGDFSWLGIGSVTRQLVTIGNNSIVGANSTVISNIPSNVVALGTPAAVIKN